MSVRTFEPGVAEHLKYYVYRLIDPRDGQTFYVGKGKGNRIFSHILDEKVSAVGTAASEKIQRIRDIKAAGLKVLHVIHRHGMDEKTSLEVEGALIDAYLGLSNIANGSGNSSTGVMHIQQINEKYAAQSAVLMHKVMIISINREIKNKSVYDAVRYCWNVSLARAQQAEVILAVANGIIRGAFVNAVWMLATRENFPMFEPVPQDEGRFGFVADEAPPEIQAHYVGKKIPVELERKRGDMSSFKYSYTL